MTITDAELSAPRGGPDRVIGAGPRSMPARGMNRLASWRVLIVSGALCVAFASVFFVSTAPFAIPEVEAACGQAPLDVRFFSTADDVNSFLTACGPAGRDSYRNMQTADLFYPLVFGLFMSSSLAMVLTRLVPWRPSAVGAAGLGLLGSCFDYLENIFAWRALAAFPYTAATNRLLGVASAAKTITFWIAGVLLLVGLGALALQKGRRRIHQLALDSATSH